MLSLSAQTLPLYWHLLVESGKTRLQQTRPPFADAHWRSFPPQIFGICLAQNLVSDVKAVKANWWREEEVGCDEAPPTHTARPHPPYARLTQHTEQCRPAPDWRAWKTNLHLFFWKKKREICRKKIHKHYFSTSPLGLVWSYEKTIAQQKTNQTLCFTARLVLLNPNMLKDCPAYFTLWPRHPLYLLFLLLGHLYFWVTVAQRLLPVSWETRSHGWKEEKYLLFAHFLLQGMMGSWSTDTLSPLPPVPHLNLRCDFSSIFNDHYDDSDHYRSTRNSDVKIFQESFQWEAQCKRKVPFISCDGFRLPCVFTDLLLLLLLLRPPPCRLTIPQGLAGTRRFLPTFTTISAPLSFFHPCAKFTWANFMDPYSRSRIVLRWLCVVRFFVFVCVS